MIAIDGLHSQVAVQTPEKQILVLDVPAESLAGMRVGERIPLQVTQQSPLVSQRAGQ